MGFSLRLMVVALLSVLALPALAARLAAVDVRVDNLGDVVVADGVVEAVRQSDIAAQVPGRITALAVKVGDKVRAGQLLARIDERIAQQQTLTGRSQVTALAAQLDAASKEYQRKQQLYKQGFLSKAALDRAESDFKTTQAQTRAQMAQVDSAIVQTGLHSLEAPYGGIISKVDIELGDMASPGKPLITMYDPGAMRVVANVPQSRAGELRHDPATIEIPAAPPAYQLIKSTDMNILPTADPVSQMIQIRFPLSATVVGLTPGMFARVRLALDVRARGRRVSVPAKTVFRRSEMTAVYVLDARGQPLLRLIRPGRTEDGITEVLAGLEPGEKVVLDPLAAVPRR